MKISVNNIMMANPCPDYTHKVVTDLWTGHKALTPTEIVALSIPIEARLWALIYCVLHNRQRPFFTYDCVERELQCEINRKCNAGRKLDAQNWATIEMAKQYAVKYATRDATWSAAESAAWSAARAAAESTTKNAAKSTAWSTARLAEHNWQLARILKYTEDKTYTNK